MKKQLTQTTRTSTHRRFEGVVVSTKENKTIHVTVESIKTHPKYRKQYTRSKKYAVHDETGKAAVGDLVLFEECRPLSKTKRWTLVNVLTTKKV
jgi:small subunit ribosomal protein S17